MAILFKKVIKAQAGVKTLRTVGEHKPMQLYDEANKPITAEQAGLNVASVVAAGDSRFSTAAGEVGRVLGIDTPKAQMSYKHSPEFVKWLNAKKAAKDYATDMPIGHFKNIHGSEYPLYGHQYEQVRQHVPNILGSDLERFDALGTYYDDPTKYGDAQKFNYGDSSRVKYGPTGVTTGGNYLR